MHQFLPSPNVRPIATLLVTIALAACGGTAPTPSGPAGSPAPASTVVASGTPAATPSQAAPSAASSASASPSSDAPNPPGFTCGGTFQLNGTTTDFKPVQVTDVRVGTHAGYDRIVVEFAGTGTPGFDLSPAVPPLVADASGLPLTVAGTSFLKLLFVSATAAGSWSGPSTFSPDYPKLHSLVAGGDFEGHFTWYVGLNGPACYHVSELSGPTRIVIDLQTP
jgi:hypothetical protein